jgi:glutaminyl-peptide cyclotransferase
VNAVLCFVGIAGPGDCIDKSTWKNRKFTHLESTRSSNKFINSNVDLRYFAEGLKNDRNFVNNFNKILIPRTIGSENHAKVREHIASSMRKLGWSVEEHGFDDNTPHGVKRFTNVIATLNPDAPRRMVLACHYDSKLDPPGFLAATDSAVPCAQMINMASTLNEDLKIQKAENDDLTLQLIFFDGEEAFVSWTSTDSIYGARALAKKWESEGYSKDGESGDTNDRIDIFVLLDLIGTSETSFVKLESSTGNWYDRLVSIENSLRNQNLVSGRTIFNNRAINGGIEDDHIPFKRRDVPILHLIVAPFPKVWHKISDNKENLDFGRISQLNKILRVFVAEYLHLQP